MDWGEQQYDTATRHTAHDNGHDSGLVVLGLEYPPPFLFLDWSELLPIYLCMVSGRCKAGSMGMAGDCVSCEVMSGFYFPYSGIWFHGMELVEGSI